MKYTDALMSSKAMRAFLTAAANEAISHAYMVVSPDESAVNEFFTLMACAAYCKDVCLTCSECVKIIDGNNIDIRHIKPDKHIVVEDIAAMIESTAITGFGTGRRIFFIHQAERMTAQAQNKLLKTLEEPNKNIMIVLGVGSEAALFDTIKSRVIRINLDCFDTDVIVDELKKLDVTGDYNLAAACSGGMLGRAERILDDEEFKRLYFDVFAMISRLQRSKDILKEASEPMFNRESIGDTLNILEVLFRDMLILKTDRQDLILSKHMEQELLKISGNYSIAALALAINKICKAREQLFRNCVLTSVVDNLLFSILEVKFKCR